jgi:hypothetical protein
VPPRRFDDLPITLFHILDAVRLALLRVLLSWLLTDWYVFRALRFKGLNMLPFFFPFFDDLPIKLFMVRLTLRLMDVYVFLARFLRGVNIYILNADKKKLR